MGILTKGNPNARELLTEILDKRRWWSTLSLIVAFLNSKGVEEVRVEFGLVTDRDLAGKPQAQDRIVQLDNLETVIRKGLEEGTIEWAGCSDFFFHALGADLAFMLCNDADLHFASADSSLLMELAHKIRASGVKVYDSGKFAAVQNRAIEIHDSALDQISLEDGVAVLHFLRVYIHSSEGRPAVDLGTGWTQEALIRIENAHIEGRFSEESREASGGYAHYLSDGSLRVNDSVSDNLIPIPLDVQGDIELTLKCWGDFVRVQGTSAKLELIGTAEYVERFQPDHG